MAKHTLYMIVALVGIMLASALGYMGVCAKDKKVRLYGKLFFTNTKSIHVIDFPDLKKRCIFSLPKQELRHLSSIHSLDSSPNGLRIIFSKCNKIGEPRKLYSINSDGKDYRLFLDVDGKGLIKPSFSPDGRKLACLISPGYRLCIIDLNNKNLDIIADSVPYEVKPSWSWDSKKIVFFRKAGKYRDGIYVINVDTRELTFATNGFSPIWSPDNKRILFSRKDGFYSFDLETKEENKVYSTKRTTRPEWSPRGDFIIYHLYTPDLGPLPSDGFQILHIISLDSIKRFKRFGWFSGPVHDVSWSE